MKHIVLVALTAPLLGCGSQVMGPTGPSGLLPNTATAIVAPAKSLEPTPPAIPGGNGNPSAAVLEAILIATPIPPSAGHYSYDLKLLVTETTGKSAAIVQAVVVKQPNGDTDMGCVPLGVRVGAGTTVDVIKSAGYCAPGVGGRFPGSTLSVAITYSDEAGGSTTLTVLTPLE